MKGQRKLSLGVLTLVCVLGLMGPTEVAKGEYNVVRGTIVNHPDQVADSSSDELIPVNGVFRHLTVAQGLNDPIVFDIEFDPFGFVWIATQAGLQRWDGRSLISFESNPDDPSTIASGGVFDLAIPADGSVWAVGPHTSRYDPLSGVFRRFEIGISDAFASSDNHVYVTIGLDVAKYDQESGQFEIIASVPAAPDVKLLEIVGDGPNGQLILAKGDDLFALDPNVGVANLIESATTAVDQQTPHLHSVIDSIVWRVDKNLKEVTRFDLQTNSFLEPIKPPLPEDDSIVGLNGGHDGQYWMGTDRSGMIRYDGEKYYQYKNDPLDKQSLAGDRTYPYVIDGSGSVWISVPGVGVDIHHGAAQGIYRISAGTADEQLTHPSVWDLYVDKAGDLWIGHELGADILNPETGLIRRIKQGPVDGTTQNVLGIGNVSAFAEDMVGNMWIGTFGGGLHVQDAETGLTRRFEDGKRFMRVPSLLMHSGGDLWVGAVSEGIYRIDPVSLEVDEVVQASGPTNQWAAGVFVEAPDGQVWAGLWDGGLLQIDPVTNEITEHHPSGAETDTAWSLAVDDDVLWAGMASGIARYEFSTGTWEHFEVRVDDSRRSVYGVVVDGDYLWVSTQLGIHQIDKQTHKVTSTHSELALTDLGFTQTAYARSGSRLYFGGAAGVSVIDLEQLRAFPEPTSTYITKLTVNDIDIEPGNVILDKHLMASDKVKLPADTLSFYLEFISPSFLEPERVTYHYRLVGFSDDWTSADSMLPRASFTNLDPGDYRFEVYAVSPSSQVGPTRMLSITVLPFWWETTWFRVGLLIVVLALVGFIIAMTVRQVRRRSAELTDRLAERERHTADLERMNERISRDSEQISMLMDSVPGGVALLDADNRVLVMRNQFSHIDLIPGLREGEIFEGIAGFNADELRGVQKHWLNVRIGEDPVRTVAIHAATPLEQAEQHWVLAYQDVTDEISVRSRAETQGRLAALGQFAAGIAHDLNNVLAVISLSAELIDDEPDARGVQTHARQVAEQVLSARDMIRQILDFSSSSHLIVRPVLATEVFAGIVDTGRRMLGASIECVLQVDPDVAESRVSVDRVRIQQMMYNLFTNARDALTDGGRITVDLSRVALGDIPVGVLGVSDVDDPTSMYVRVSVSDTGTGIADDVLATMFEPFRTTKPKGHGVGLGLGQVYGIVRLHRGLISVDTELGVGTTVAIHLPEMGVDPVADAGGELEDVVPRLAGARQVLLVDDNVALLSLVTTALSGAGYDVDACSDGQTAFVRWMQRRHDVIVTDLFMPGMSGEDLILRVRAVDPDVGVVVITGNPGLRSHAFDDDSDPISNVELLIKPVRRGALVEAIERSLLIEASAD